MKTSKMRPLIVLLTALHLCMISTIPSVIHAQIVTQNDGFEGKPDISTAPEHWINCEDGHSTIDTQPGMFHNQKPPTEGDSYISMVTRRIGAFANTGETCYAKLVSPFEKGKCYQIEVDLSLSDEFRVDDIDTYYFDTPCVLQILGFNGTCRGPLQMELLWASEVLENYDWETFEIELSPTQRDYEFIAFHPAFYPWDNYQNSVVFIDNLRFKESSNAFMLENGILTLPEYATDISWYFNGNVVEGAHTIYMPLMGKGHYQARFFDENNCFVLTEETFMEVDSDYLRYFPNPSTEDCTIEYFSGLEGDIEIQLFNELGQLIREQNQSAKKGINEISLHVRSLASDVYFVHINRKELSPLVCKIVVAH